MFNEDYHPKTFSEIHGQNKPIKEIIAWINTWPSSKKALLIYGPPGIGKTVSVYVLKKEMNLDLIELNTSDVRNAENIVKIVGNAASSKALFSSKKIILIDEVDNIKGRSDLGGVKALAKIIDETQNPIILIANDPYKISASLRNKLDTIRFNTLRPASVRNRLRQIADEEEISVTDEQLDMIAERSGGDLRASINDLESLGRGVGDEDIRRLSPRDSENTIFEGLTAVFKEKGLKCRETFFDIDKPPDEIIFWIDENMPRVYDPKDVPCAYNYLSRADVFLGRVRRRQYYRFWAYAMDLMTGGVSVCHRGKAGFVKYESPSYFRYLGRTKSKRNLTKEMLKKIGERTHSSSYDAKAYLPMLELACKETESGMNVARYFDLEQDELELICPSSAKKIFKSLEKREKTSEKKEKKRKVQKNKSDKDVKDKKNENKKESKGKQTSLFNF